MYSRFAPRSTTQVFATDNFRPPTPPGVATIDGMRALAQIALLKSQTAAAD